MSVGVLVGVTVGVIVGVSVGVSVGVLVGVLVGVSVGVCVGVCVGVLGVFKDSKMLSGAAIHFDGFIVRHDAAIVANCRDKNLTAISTD